MNLILYCYLFFNILVALSAFYTTPYLPNINLSLAIFYQIQAVLFVIAGWIIFSILPRRPSQGERIFEIIPNKKKLFSFLSYSFILSGLASVIGQIYSSGSLGEYLLAVITFNATSELREIYLTPSGEGGLPGVIKMFHIAPLAVYFVAASLAQRETCNSSDRRFFRKHAIISGLAILLKVFLVMDRISLIGLAVPLAHQTIRYLTFSRFLKMSPAFFIAYAALHYISESRLAGHGPFDFLLLYSKLGIVNLQIMLSSLEFHTHGFSTVLSPFIFVLNAFSLPTPATPMFEWEWNPAQFLTSYVFMDIGHFAFVAFFWIGLFLRWIELKSKRAKFTSFYYAATLTVITTFTVPFFRSVEFWLLLLIVYILGKSIGRERLIICNTLSSNCNERLHR